MLTDMQLFGICNIGGFFVFFLIITFHFVNAYGGDSDGKSKKAAQKKKRSRKPL